VGIHALVGGVRAMNDLGAVITTPTASYFIVNNNTRSDKDSLRVYNTKTIAEAMLQTTDFIELIGGDKINTPYQPKKGVFDNRFSNISVELRLRDLRTSITPKV
jgi:hypothetical protein